MSLLGQIRIILVNTSHPGNIGSVARAMKTMGLEKLYLVSPQQFPHAKAVEMASGAVDILENARVTESLAEAIADCVLVVGTSTRSRTLPWPLCMPRELAQRVEQAPQRNPVAIVFGREQTGLTNAELQQCQLCVQIPANPDYSSLNIAAAVQVIAYELHIASLGGNVPKEREHQPVSSEDMERFFVHLQEVLVETDFLRLRAPRKLMARLRRLFFRACPDAIEMNILRGILTSVQERIKNAKLPS
ncbi:MAG: tRNA (cytosine(32)/uridine(32)-2'-O)-methyltransferase TrmJ [Gammaproteobacteria bacterium RIFCSPHIGHO2_12_FULL_41_20]|nr:MAG: tRNA (cytosine(32)/uridine(32)-2'-O)-methyltransferase TrmJ [Gammaproteobacteria bacterium RIFCSPHIGHO2_12_FULL_41_20]